VQAKLIRKYLAPASRYFGHTASGFFLVAPYISEGIARLQHEAANVPNGYAPLFLARKP
jgi:hypothetical protein